MNAAQYVLTLALRAYRAVISPVLTAVFGPMGLGCRYTPTCSEYALQAVRLHGATRGSWLAARRVCRCHPWGGHGHDPVPLNARTVALGVPPGVEPRHPARRNEAAIFHDTILLDPRSGRRDTSPLRQARKPDATDSGEKCGLTISEHLP